MLKSNPEYDQTRVEFEDEWSRNKIEDLIRTNDYKRARQERNLYENYLSKGGLILEAGCGLGPKVIYFKKKGFRVVGVDFVPSALKRLKQFDPSINLAACDIHDCPFPDDSFVAYLSYGVVEHFPHGSQDAIIEAYRVLKKGGIILMMVPAENSLSRFIHDPNNFLNRLRRHPLVRKFFNKPKLDDSMEHDLYMKLHTRQEMCEILKNVGFEVMVEEPVGHSFSLFMLSEIFQKDSLGQTNALAEMLGELLKRMFPWRTANHLLFVGKK